MDKFELQKLRDLPIEGVAERLGLRVVRHKALCPFHDDHHASLSFKVSKNTFRCFVCDAKGGTIDLVMSFLNKDFREACRWLADEHNIILDEWKCTPALGPKGRFACEEPTPLCTFASQPSAGLLKVLIQIFHHQVNGSAACPTNEATEGVLAHLERERGMVVVVERTERLVPHHPHSEPLRDPLDGKAAKLLQFILFHKKTLPPAPPCEGGE